MPSGHKRKKSSKQEKEYEEFLFGKDILQKDEVDGKIDPVEYSIDRAGTTVDAKSVSKHAWHDDDDDDIEVDLDQTNRLKKLNKTDENIVSGTTLTALFQERFATKKLKWATATEKEVENSEENGLDLMRQTDSMIDNSSGGRSDLGPLKNGKINIRRMVNANIAEPSKKPISALSFHSSGDLLMTAGHDKVMRFFKIDGDKNEKQLSVKFDMAISSASYLGTSADVIVAGRKPYFYSYDTNSGNLNKIPGPVGRDLQSLEHMYTSKDGSKVAFTGVGGYIHILNGRTKSWMTDLKMNSPVRSVCFVDEFTVATSGLDADIYIWDIRNSGRCVARFPHEDGSCSSFLSSYSPPSLVASSSSYPSYRLTDSSYLAVGTESGVVSIFNDPSHSDESTIGGSSSSAHFKSSSGKVPQPFKSVMSLTTKVTRTAFHPSGQILAIASQQKKDELKLIHMPTGSVFTNWPTDKTPFNRVHSMAFSPGGAYFAVGNNVGKVLLYKLNHFGTA